MFKLLEYQLAAGRLNFNQNLLNGGFEGLTYTNFPFWLLRSLGWTLEIIWILVHAEYMEVNW